MFQQGEVKGWNAAAVTWGWDGRGEGEAWWYFHKSFKKWEEQQKHRVLLLWSGSVKNPYISIPFHFVRVCVCTRAVMSNSETLSRH